MLQKQIGASATETTGTPVSYPKPPRNDHHPPRGELGQEAGKRGEVGAAYRLVTAGAMAEIT